MKLKFSFVLALLVLIGAFLLIKNQTDADIKPTVAKLNIAEISELKTEVQLENMSTKKSENSSKKKIDKSPRKLSFEELTTLLKNDDVCEIVQSGAPVKLLYRALLEAPSFLKENPEDTDFAKDLLYGTFNGNFENRSSGLATTFMNALLFADLLVGLNSPHKDLNEANRLLADLEISDPENSAPSLFRAVVFQKLGFSENEIRNKTEEAMQKPLFNTYINQLGRYLLEKGYNNPSYSIISQVVIYKLPIPNLSEVYQLINLYISKYPELALGLEAFGQSLMSDGLAADFKYEMAHWNVLDYTIGISMIKKYYKIIKPNQSLPKFRTYQALGQSDYENAFLSLNSDYPNRTQNCDRNLYDRHFKKEQIAYKEFLNKKNP